MLDQTQPSTVAAAALARPRILIASWLRWASAARVAAGLIDLNAEVHSVSPAFHPLAAVSGIESRRLYRTENPTRSLRRAIEQTDPDLIVSCDDETTGRLHSMLTECTAGSQEDARLRQVIERSFGSAETFAICRSRAALLGEAAAAGVRVARASPVTSMQSLSAWIEQNGLPAYLKTDGTHGGNGVRCVRTMDEAERAYRRLSAPPSPIEAAKYFIKQQDLGRFAAMVRRRRAILSVQRAVEGRPANCLAVCREGEVVGYLAAEVEATLKPTGFGTLIHFSDNADMKHAACAIARRLNLSGVFGLDFIIETGGEAAYLIEMNPRVTPLAHFRFRGNDPVAAILALAGGGDVHAYESSVAAPTGAIAVFPHMLKSGVPSAAGPVYADVPWDNADLVRLSMPLPRGPLALLHELLCRFFL